MLSVLGVKTPHKHNGTWDVVQPMLADGWHRDPDTQGATGTALSTVLFASLLLLHLTS